MFNSFLSEMLKTATLENLLYFLIGVLFGLSIRPLFLYLTKKQKLKRVCIKDMKLENDLTKRLYPNLGYKLVTKKTPFEMVFKKDKFKYIICPCYRDKKCVLDNDKCKILKSQPKYQPLETV
ncbi:hypothetical protein WHQ30_06625 [Campylobacter jejuni]|uniref:hypothetical protein n=1 Tax=Campylobacter jejuni TaxID=197 RepID=UPI0030CDC3FD